MHRHNGLWKPLYRIYYRHRFPYSFSVSHGVSSIDILMMTTASLICVHEDMKSFARVGISSQVGCHVHTYVTIEESHMVSGTLGTLGLSSNIYK